MWKVLANKYRDDFAFANHCDHKGKSSEALGYDAGTQKESKILVYPAGSTKPFLFEGMCSPSSSNPRMTLLISIISAGTLKYNSISNFFNSILDGTANFIARNTEVLEDNHKLVPEEQEIERGQMDDSDKEEGYTNEREEDIIHRAIRIQLEKEEREAKDAHIDSLLKTRTTDPVEVKQRTAAETAHPFNMKAPSDKEPLPSPEDPISESGRIKDEL
jgi:hypothetical protein